jgi:hypothetical protein
VIVNLIIGIILVIILYRVIHKHASVYFLTRFGAVAAAVAFVTGLFMTIKVLSEAV